MLQFFMTAYQICFFKKGPEDISYSIYRLVTATFILFALLLGMDSLLETDQQEALGFELVLVLCPFIYVAVVLWITHKRNRYVQSMSAVIGVECWINLVMVIFICFVVPLAPDLLVQFFPIVIYIWRLTILSFIFKRMISTDSLAAILLTVSFEMLRIMTVLSMMG